MSSVRLNSWAKLKYHDPGYILKEHRRIELSGILNQVKDQRVRTLRTNKQKQLREGRDAALFCYGLEKAVLGTKVFFSMCEHADYDFVLCYKDNDATVNYAPVQLKEVISPSDIDEGIKKLSKYTDSKDLIVALKLNIEKRVILSDMEIPSLNIKELWIYGTSNREQTQWFLFGNILSEPDFYEFDYPELVR